MVAMDDARAKFLSGKRQVTIYLNDANDKYILGIAADRLKAGDRAGSSVTHIINDIVAAYRAEHPRRTKRPRS